MTTQPPVDVLRTLAADKYSIVREDVGRNPSTPVDVLRTLAADKSEDVRTGVAGNRMTPVDVLRTLAADKSEDVRTGVAGNRMTPVDVLRNLAKDKPKEVRASVAGNRTTPVDVLHALVTDESNDVRTGVAGNPATPVDVLRTFANHNLWSVRQAVGGNPATPVRALRSLANDREVIVRQAVGGNPATPVRALRSLANDREVIVRQYVGGNPAAPVDVLRTLATNENEHVRQYVGGNPATPVDVLRTLANDWKSECVRQAVGGNPATPVDVLRDFATNKSRYVRRAILGGNPATPVDVLRDFATNRDENVRRAVGGNPATPIDVLRTLAADENAGVRGGVGGNVDAGASMPESVVGGDVQANDLPDVGLGPARRLTKGRWWRKRAEPDGDKPVKSKTRTTTRADALTVLATYFAEAKADCQLFSDEFYPESAGAWVAASEVVSQYGQWCRARGREQMPDDRLLAMLQSIGWRPRTGNGNAGFIDRSSKRARELALKFQSGFSERSRIGAWTGNLGPESEQSDAELRSRPLTAIDPRTDRSAAEAALADPGFSAALMDSGVEIPEWAVSPSILLNVSAMGADQCARLLAHPAITHTGLVYIVEQMNDTAASTLAARRDTPAVILDTLARYRSDEPILIAIARNPQRTTQTLEALVDGTNASVVQAALVGLLEMHSPSQVALIIAALAPETMSRAIASLPTSAALSLATDSGVSVQILRALAEIYPDQKVQSAVLSNGATTPAMLAVIAKSGGSPEVRALVALDPRTDRTAAETTLADPRVSAALMDGGAEIPDWVLSPRVLLDVTGMEADQCARLLAHPSITTPGLEYIVERMNDNAASALAARRNTPAGILDVLARKRSNEPILIAIAGNPQRTTQTLEALLAGPNPRVVQAAIVGLLQTHYPSQVALIITNLQPKAMGVAVAGLPTPAAHSMATDPRTSMLILRALAEIHPDREVQTAVVFNGATTPELLAVIAKSGGSPEVRALVALDPRTDRTAAETALADPRVSAAVMEGGAEIPEWVVSPVLRLNVTGMGANQCIRLLSHPAVTPAVVLAELARARCDEQTLVAIARNSGSTPETLEALMQHGIATVSRAAATSPNAPPELLRRWIVSLDIGSRVRLAGESNLSTAMQRELSRDTSEQVRDCLLRNAQLDPAIATMMRRRPHLELPPTT